MSTATQEKIQNHDAPAAGAGSQAPAVIERMPRNERIVVESGIPVLDTAKFDHMTRIAKLMASSSLVPEHLNCTRKVGGQDVAISEGEAIANCFLVVNQAVRWNMDPFAVAQHIFITKGRIGYEGKLIAAVINTHPSVIERLSYRFEGEQGKPNRKVIVSAKTSDMDKPKEIDGTVQQWQTTERDGTVKSAWKGNADQQLTYRGAREWARRWLPEAILGVYGDDEVEQFNATDARVPGDQPAQPPQRGASALKAALGAGAAAATDATIIDTALAAAAAMQLYEEGADTKKSVGTVEQRNEITKKFAGCNDLEVLDLAVDESRDFEWTKPDQDVITAEYIKRRTELGAA